MPRNTSYFRWSFSSTLLLSMKLNFSCTMRINSGFQMTKKSGAVSMNEFTSRSAMPQLAATAAMNCHESTGRPWTTKSGGVMRLGWIQTQHTAFTTWSGTGWGATFPLTIWSQMESSYAIQRNSLRLSTHCCTNVWLMMNPMFTKWLDASQHVKR